MKKKNLELSQERFCTNIDQVKQFTKQVRNFTKSLTNEDKDSCFDDLCFDMAIIVLYREFENFMLDCLVTMINKDSSIFSERTKRKFPNHMNVEVCRYLICGDGYFDFKGRKGLIDKISKYVPKNHTFLKIIQKSEYEDALNQLSALRNFAAHDSSVAKKRAIDSLHRKRLRSSGAWLKREKNFEGIADKLKTMAEDICDDLSKNT